MSVHHIINDIRLENGGAQRVVRSLHKGLCEQGVDSRLVALCDSSDSLEAAISLNNVSPYRWKTFFSVMRYVRQHCSPQDIIHVHLFPSLLYVAIATRLVGWKGQLVCTEHSTSNGRRSHPLGKLIDSFIYPAYDRIYSISQGTQNTLASWMPRQISHMRVVENGACLPHTAFRERGHREKLIVVSVGRLSKPKNYENALKAIALLDHSNFEYRIAGIGVEEAALKALCAELGLEKTVKFYGYVEDVVAFLQAADIFLMPSLWEGFGLAAVEAMNAGLPVVASNVIGLKEIFEVPEPCGLLINPNCPSEIAEAVETFWDAERRLLYGKNAFVRSLHFSHERMIQAYCDEYNLLSVKS